MRLLGHSTRAAASLKAWMAARKGEHLLCPMAQPHGMARFFQVQVQGL